jgi:hypothetical protein
MAQPIEVSSAGIHAYGVNCAQHATRVYTAAASPPAVPANPAQATALAVGAIHGALSYHAAKLAERMSLTARAAVSSAAQYSNAETANADALVGVIG